MFARRSLNESAPLAEKVDPPCFAVLDGLTRVYSALLDRIEKKPRLIIGARPVHLSIPMKTWIAASSYAKGWSRRMSAAAEEKKSSIGKSVRAKAAKK